MKPQFSPGRITFRKLNDLATDKARLRIELLDDVGRVAGELELVADAITNADDPQSLEFFAFWVDEAPRKAQYLQEYDRNGNLEAVRSAIRDDFDAHFFRARRDRGHFEGLGDEALRRWHMTR